MEKRLTPISGGRIGRPLTANISVPDRHFNPDEKHMGSTTIGTVNPAMTGLAMPQDIKIDRVGNCRVRVGGRA
jgi:hypothetical protein